MYKVTFLPDAEESFKKLAKSIQLRIAKKIDWLAKNAEIIIHQASLTPSCNTVMYVTIFRYY